MESFILDFIVVVLGILFALFLNRFNEIRKNKKRIHSIMNIIVDNMNADLSSIQFFRKDIDHKFALFDKLQKKSLMSEEELKECMLLATDYMVFGISRRGYNLLKDARIDFEFKNSELISTLAVRYDWYLSTQKMYDRLALNISEKNTRSLYDLDCSMDFYNNILSEEVKNHMQTNDYLNMVQYFLYSMCGNYKKLYEDWERDISKHALPAIYKSDFK